MTDQARVVPAEEASSVRGRQASPTIKALLEGQMLHYPDARRRFNATDLRKRYGAKLRTRGDGNGGRYWWLEWKP